MTFAASFDLMRRVPGDIYLWRMRAIPLSGYFVGYDEFYINQRFTMPPTGHLEPTFAETLTLPTGKYRLSIQLYRVPGNFHLPLLQDEQVAEGYSSVGADEIVTIK